MPPMQEGHKEFLMSKNWGSKIDFSHPSWEELSKEAKALIQNMLNPNYEKRIKAVQGLNDKWLLLLTKAKRSNQKKFLNQKVLLRLKYFIAEFRLLEAFNKLAQ